MNTGRKLKVCPSCNRRRFHTRLSNQQDYRVWQCSQGHRWSEPIPTMERVTDMLKAIYTPMLPQLFQAESPFLRLRK